MSSDAWSDVTDLIVNHDLRFVFCVVGKAACTSWIRVLLQLTGNPAAQLLATADRSNVHIMRNNYVDPMSLENATHRPFSVQRLLQVHVRSRAAGKACFSVSR